MKNDYYIIVGICTTGAHFYSDTLLNNDQVISFLDQYAGVVHYFGGGTIYVYHIVDNVPEITFSKKI